MARIDFYVLARAGESSREDFSCRLAEKAYRLEHSVHFHTRDREQATRLDDLLWTFRDGSFVPHELVSAGDTAVESPITIGCAPDSIRPAALLINLTDELPPELAAFPRVAEIVTSDEDRKRRSRELFAEYRSQGHSLELHEIG
jgi:DNA polymerase-3 subunit chi